MRLAAAALALLPLAAGSCAPAREPAEWATLREVTPAFLAERHAIHATLAADRHGRAALAFVTRDGSGGADLWLSVSADSGVTFGAPVRVNERAGAVVSHDEARPAAAFGLGGRLALAWSESRGDTAKPLAADLFARASGDGGASLGPAVRVNDDLRAPPCFHGFPALAFLDNGTLVAAWMDERNNKPWDTSRISASLVASRSLDGGRTWSPNAWVSDRMCPCCRPALSTDGVSLVTIGYRAAVATGRARTSWSPIPPGEEPIHDPAIATSLDGGATFTVDTLLSDDGWRMNGCPADGPALAWGGGGEGVAAWRTGAPGGPGLWIAPWSAPHGLVGMKRALADSIAEAAHPALAELGGATLVGAEARAAADSGLRVFAVRALAADGSLTPWLFLGTRARSGALAALDGRSALAAWTEQEGAAGRVRVVRLVRR